MKTYCPENGYESEVVVDATGRWCQACLGNVSEDGAHAPKGAL